MLRKKRKAIGVKQVLIPSSGGEKKGSVSYFVEPRGLWSRSDTKGREESVLSIGTLLSEWEKGKKKKLDHCRHASFFILTGEKWEEISGCTLTPKKKVRNRPSFPGYRWFREGREGENIWRL